MANHTLLKELQQKIDYQFKDENLLFTAVTHSSYANEHKLHKIHHNERLEFLGDAVLEIVSSDFLFKNFPDMAEGQMSKKRASLVCEPTLAYCARQIGLGKYLMQEILQKNHRDPITYEVVDMKGPEHNRMFVMQVKLGDTVIGQGSGRTKQAAGQEAAYHAILALKNQQEH